MLYTDIKYNAWSFKFGMTYTKYPIPFLSLSLSLFIRERILLYFHYEVNYLGGSREYLKEGAELVKLP